MPEIDSLHLKTCRKHDLSCKNAIFKKKVKFDRFDRSLSIHSSANPRRPRFYSSVLKL